MQSVPLFVLHIIRLSKTVKDIIRWPYNKISKLFPQCKTINAWTFIVFHIFNALVASSGVGFPSISLTSSSNSAGSLCTITAATTLQRSFIHTFFKVKIVSFIADVFLIDVSSPWSVINLFICLLAKYLLSKLLKHIDTFSPSDIHLTLERISTSSILLLLISVSL